ncbi:MULTISPECIES: transglycosylase domain-containing protein [Filomicrobium]|uniref:peptidoglycan glycosyltransferase n=1 Tax=Filomicrobium insigne TaxID=418854 RepID=A0A1H0IHN6_9HYPH|nr:MULTISPECIES: transglycosylase domain-containing protein [Filomicrobium]MCV0368234.1 transglycosylase domain-containing protein [Filomicrobium sp.]SDO30561.1 Membrane carboxypeptidase (penicillin-binding protein) [Filomicrobium insigne]
MITIAKLLMLLLELAVALPVRMVRFATDWIFFNPRIGPLRYVAWAAFAYLFFALTLVYIIAPIRGYAGQAYLSERLRYDAERWLATAIYDAEGNFVGTFDPRLDSRQDVNWTGQAIEVGHYVANPDHKSIPVRDVPENYWKCLTYHEDRYIGTPLNPFGIDLLGVLKIPYSTIRRSIALKRLSLGVGGSTLPMQLARVIYKTPPHLKESTGEKIRRKLAEWWLAPVIYFELTRDGDETALKQWAANHLWLAQRTGGQSLHGVEVASQIVFGKEAKDLSVAEQFILASAVNKPIILLEGSERLNAVRLDRWRYIAEVRARTCAEALIDDPAEQARVVFDLVGLAGGPPDPQVKPKLEAALELNAPDRAARARANPVIRANTLMPSARFGIREEMKQIYGFDWRNHVRGVTTTFDAAENLAFHGKIEQTLMRLNHKWGNRLNPGYTLDPQKTGPDLKIPDVTVVAADAAGNIVRYYESGETAAYFGSPFARDTENGSYVASREGRMLASTGKVLAAIAIANEGKDGADSLYLDTNAPARGLETCSHHGNLRRGRQARVVFACSLNEPLMIRTAQIGQARVKKLIDAFGFNMPPTDVSGAGTPPSTAVVLGQIAGSPRRVHQMSGVVLASLLGRDRAGVRPPSLIRDYDYTNIAEDQSETSRPKGIIVPRDVIARDARPLLKSLLEAPLCYESNRTSHGTLKSLNAWCASRRNGLRLHFAKTGTQVSEDPNATVDGWVTGGLQFDNGAAYSYVVLVGTGTASEPWARSLHSSQIAAPLVATLLGDLEAHARQHPQSHLLPASNRTLDRRPVTEPKLSSHAPQPMSEAERQRVFNLN